MKLLRIFIALIGLYCGCVQAGSYPETMIKHKPITLLAPSHRLLLEAEITDPAHIDKVRCYFRVAASAGYLFTPMTRTTGDAYNCSIPAVRNASGSLEYLIVVKNKRSQVIRTRTYISEIRHQETLPKWQRLLDNESSLTIFDELNLVTRVPTGFNDRNLKLAHINNRNDLFGLKIDIYNIAQVPASLKVMPGYFGGFSIDEAGDVFPVEGYAINLKLSDVSFLKSVLYVIHEDALNLTGENWEGEFYRTDSSSRQSITASAVHSGGSIDIDTSRSNGSIAGRFEGNINSSGDMFVYDKYDNEIWTTHFGPAQQDRFVLADFVYKPVAGQPRPPLYIVEMDRELPPHVNIAPLLELLL